ncbi:MAG: cache domain-containing protein [Arcobacteraceae bacterium]|nr:cache domain-containing protein [Arcobacteraceae bacterium]
MREKTFLNIITYGPLVFIPLFVATIIFVAYQTYTKNFDEKITKLEETIYNDEKKRIENKVINITDFIVYEKSKINDKLTKKVKERVDTAYLIATNIYNENKDKKSEKELKKIIQDALRPFVWNDGESFIWIVDYDGVFHLAPQYLKNLEGSSIFNFQDSTGRLVIQEEIALCKEKNGGFIWDTFTKPTDATKQYKQVAYVKPFGHFDWYFGSGEYLDTATEITDKELFSMVEQIDDIGTNYIFIIDTDKNMLVNRQMPNLVGKDINITDPLLKGTLELLLKQASIEDKSFFTYDWYNKKTNQVEPKISFIQKVPKTNWIIGSGFFLSEIDKKFLQKKTNLENYKDTRSNTLIYIAISIIILSLLFSLFISRTIKKSFTKYKIILNHKNEELEELNHFLEKRVKERTLELEKIKNDFETLATTDSLTNLNNRYSLMNLFEIELSRAKRYSSPLSILMYDIDYFKHTNDTFGHDAGDKVLIELSQLIKHNLRDMDIIGRYGGEEFLILLPNTSLNDAKNFAERLRHDVENHNFSIVDTITISIGVVEYQTDETLDDIFKRVDELLYTSKENGRNKVSF